LINPNLLYRFGSPRLYGYLGGGLGAEVSQSAGRFLVQESTPVPPTNYVVRDIKLTNTGRLTNFVAGFAASPTESIVIRVGFYSAFRYAVPNAGVKIGIGYRF
jgi:hypothetical protein